MNDQVKLELIAPNHTVAYLSPTPVKKHNHNPSGNSEDISLLPRNNSLVKEEQKKRSQDFDSRGGLQS